MQGSYTLPTLLRSKRYQTFNKIAKVEISVKSQKQRGFTMVELMIVVAVIALLSAVAIPSYTKYAARAKRSAAESAMLGMANKQERYMLDARAYATSLSGLAYTVPSEVSPYYNISITADNSAAPPTYTITAAPKGSQATADALCGTLTLNSVGTKSAAGSGCW
jgi:type IV pilus assembly protein PilE